jgi:hypothetical protein
MIGPNPNCWDTVMHKAAIGHDRRSEGLDPNQHPAVGWQLGPLRTTPAGELVENSKR